MQKEIQKKIENINYYQNSGTFHPLTCGNNSNHDLLIPFYDEKDNKLKLKCEDCDYIQDYIPSVPTIYEIDKAKNAMKDFINLQHDEIGYFNNKGQKVYEKIIKVIPIPSVQFFKLEYENFYNLYQDIVVQNKIEPQKFLEKENDNILSIGILKRYVSENTCVNKTIKFYIPNKIKDLMRSHDTKVLNILFNKVSKKYINELIKITEANYPSSIEVMNYSGMIDMCNTMFLKDHIYVIEYTDFNQK